MEGEDRSENPAPVSISNQSVKVTWKYHVIGDVDAGLNMSSARPAIFA